MSVRFSLAVLVIVGFSGYAAAFVESGTNDYVSYHHAVLSSPIVLTVPYGGEDTPAGIPDREAGCGDPCTFTGCSTPDPTNCPITTGSQSPTLDAALAIRAAVAVVTGSTPAVIHNNLSPSKMDPNAPVEEGAQVNPATLAYNEYHKFINDAVREVSSSCGTGLLLNLQIQADSDDIQLGYRLSDSQLGLSNAELQLIDAADTSLKPALTNPTTSAGRTLPQFLHGPYSMGSLLDGRGYSVVPSNATLHADGGPYTFTGETLERLATQRGINAIDVSLPASLFGPTSPISGDQVAADFAQVLVTFFSRMFAINLSPGMVGCPNSVTDCALDGPSGSYWFNGAVWDVTCNVVLHGSCAVDATSSSQMMYNDPDSTTPVRLFRRLSAKMNNMERRSASCDAGQTR